MRRTTEHSGTFTGPGAELQTAAAAAANATVLPSWTSWTSWR